ncbi:MULTISPECIES: hypothetical protein [unclassified Sphingopyxis]|jgi:hypothetical protein|uniref:hypothetical protein n=1 Tax=unclassified Sphingopyxis TaxID=2614943 RepID=UPI0007307E12|nr:MULTISPECIES: hypothetical protein [unclassified Sphingopyxis]KTE21571.1 hypothetical protein ATE61_19260 [Sphingopyxis sp. H057]KTE49568.1 hypothetical protein ATE64_19265 [Sphingopyxis sp. H073]KTE49774.1 hypothetical protein ATE69_19585 [Sphingopyxis sp. H071]KTE58194.1 hypothetical protein ATE66_16230 [Sphingopyxis sp. H107]KTE62657.1 hypothetical protein ATE65_16515 [Sphingopyxis sp. H100]
MNFFNLIQSLDDLLYEVMSWLVFYPVTLWRTLVRPLQMMDYSDVEQGDAADEQYTDTLSPPLFLLLSLILVHAAEIALVGDDAMIASKVGLAAFVSNNTDLIILRIVSFSLFPVMLATRMVRAQKLQVDRDTLRAPFYSQCYVAAVLAMLLGGGVILIKLAHDWSVLAGGALALFGLLWFGFLQTAWFNQHLKCGRLKAFGHASRAMVESLVAMTLLSSLFA